MPGALSMSRERSIWQLLLPAAGVEPAARARVAAARALHHPAALLAGRTEVESLAQRRDDRWFVGQRGRGRQSGARGAAAIALATVTTIATVACGAVAALGGLALGRLGGRRPGDIAEV